MKQQLIKVFLATAALLLTYANGVSGQNDETAASPDGVVLFVEFSFDENDLDTAIELMTQMQSQVLENEEGCLAYDLLMSEEEPNKIFVYESYENQDAVKKHNNSPYFKEIVGGKLKKLIKNQTVKTLYLVNTEENEAAEDFMMDAEP
ncbi:MAG TPA: putative quinol monooxygenase [Dysgonamonadaceae bacterium]|nr:putative quinol monooxygenase [Dysgonamonadaceae bacterium]HOT64570.1 putative quinol monooxygenase [Dysgonamonadaceae bacterium]HPD43246.1 putative quinol monooxygenase [Dysgonamonadaceae bacterium]HQI42812.1 putative quinol monooxygenase [Dysgonamonadaceae bacterium]HRS40556.1 putative quinol monooxygenase [Dysgonamonadaceae bacterium]